MLDKILERTKKTPECWLWTGYIHPKDGYGRVYTGRKSWQEMAHRVAYEVFTGISVPSDMTIDHLCLNKKCVNPEHLEIVSRKENSIRAKTWGREFPDKCKKGHSLEGVIWSNGQRRLCKVCRKDYMQIYMANRRLRAS